MNAKYFNRMPRLKPPLPHDEVKVPGPPSISEPPQFNWLSVLLPIAGVFFMVGVYGFIYQNWLLAIPMVAMSGFSTLGSIVGRRVQRKNQLEKIEKAEANYTQVLEQKRNELEVLRSRQREIRLEKDPNLQVLLSRVQQLDPRLWERRPEDDDFLCLRLGIGDLPSTVEVSAPHPDMPDPRLERAHEIEAEYQNVSQVPVVSNLRLGPLGIAGRLAQRTDLARSLICNLVVHHSPDEVHLLGIYSSNRVFDWAWLKWLPHTYALEENPRRYLACDPDSCDETLKLLMDEIHRRENKMYGMRHDAAVPQWPWLVLLVENYELVRDHPAIHQLLKPETRNLNATAIFLVDSAPHVPMGCNAIAEVLPTGGLKYAIARASEEPLLCRPEMADVSFSENLARSLAPIQVYSFQSDSAMPTHVRLLDQLNVNDIEQYNVARQWEDQSSEQYLEEYLKVPIGERRGDQLMLLDLNHTGHGPHGLIAGTTGSGKSELVQTLVVALAMKHHPHDVGFVLVDFKGGGTFSELKDLPHTLGMVTDLSGNLTERALIALKAEMDRRKELFNRANVNDIGPYQRRYWNGQVEDPLPRLVVIIDEFAELVSDYPDFMDGLIGIARVGRSLGVHLILATQSPAGVVKQQIWANAKFRICLRVESSQESQEMLRRPEAADLPRIPGRGYLQVGNNDVFELFQVARVAGEYHSQGDTDSLLRGEKEHAYIAKVTPTGEREVMFDSSTISRRSEEQGSALTDIDVVVKRLSMAAEQMNIRKLPSPWPDPLPEHIALPDVLRVVGYAGWNGNTWVFNRPAFPICYTCGAPMRREANFCNACGEPAVEMCSQCGTAVRLSAQFCNTCGTSVEAPSQQPAYPSTNRPSLPIRPWLGVTLGLMDDPARQRQLPLRLELNDQDGHLVIIGSPGSGKDMLLRTFIASLARTHAPDELHFYLIEFGGQAFKVFENLPHMGGIFTSFDDERIRRLLLLLIDALEERKERCNHAGVDGLVRLREVRPDDAPAAIVVAITGFMEFRNKFQEEMLQLTRLIREGGAYGIHVVIVGDRAGDLSSAILSVISRRFVLRLADADEYSLILGTRIKINKEQRIPSGRGWYGRPPLEFQTALPGYEKDENAQIKELQEMALAMERSWGGKVPKPIRALPDVITVDEVLEELEEAFEPRGERQLAVPIGLDGLRMSPLVIDLNQDGPDFIISSTPQGGKTTLLLTWLLMLAEVNSPQQVQFVIASGRRDSLKSLRELPHVLDYRKDAGTFCEDGGTLTWLLAEIERRDKLLSQHTRTGTFPHIVVVFDDYDEFAGLVGTDNKVQDGLSALARQGRDVDMHTLVTGPMPNMGVEFRDALVRQLKIGRSGFLLRILNTGGSNPLDVSTRTAKFEAKPGRGYVVRNGYEQTVQIATPGSTDAAAKWATRIARYWKERGVMPATWPELEKQGEGKGEQ